jgi:hypothetical protein
VIDEILQQSARLARPGLLQPSTANDQPKTAQAERLNFRVVGLRVAASADDPVATKQHRSKADQSVHIYCRIRQRYIVNKKFKEWFSWRRLCPRECASGPADRRR